MGTTIPGRIYNNLEKSWERNSIPHSKMIWAVGNRIRFQNIFRTSKIMPGTVVFNLNTSTKNSLIKFVFLHTCSKSEHSDEIPGIRFQNEISVKSYPSSISCRTDLLLKYVDTNMCYFRVTAYGYSDP